MASLKGLIRRLVFLFEKFPGLMAVLAFASGVASYVLVEGRETFAQVIAVLMLASWLLLVLEKWLRAGFRNRFNLDMPPAIMRFGTQMVHQESLFFALPFFLAATSWNHGQAVFTSVLILCALISVIDPLYYKQLAPRRSLYLLFHALTLFAVLMVALPLIFQLNTRQSLQLALLIAFLFSLPSLGNLFANGGRWRLPMITLLLLVMAGGLWVMRIWVPPAVLELRGISLSQYLDAEQRSLGPELEQIDATTLREGGLYALTSVRAPRGLRDQIHHVWIHNGAVVDRITLEIEGVSNSGYRAWTHKLNFPADPAGRWQVRVVTDSGQLIGVTRFTVT
ncbi:MAG: DUF5924 family protein, partial [Pseudohongiella sp.]